MSKRNLTGYEQYYYKQGKRKSGRKSFFAFLFVIIVISVVIFFSISFSQFLTVSKVVNVNTNYIVTEKYVYGLSLGNFSKTEDANNFSDDLKKQGGAGAIYFENEYKVLSSIYPTINEAKSVQKNLKELGTESEIVKICLNPLNFNVNLSSNSQKILSESINLFYNSYKSLYDYSILFDKKEIDAIKAKENIFSLLERNKKIIEKYNDYFKTSSNVCILYTKIYLSKLNQIVSNLNNCDEKSNLSCEIKNSYCDVIFLYINFTNDIDF